MEALDRFVNNELLLSLSRFSSVSVEDLNVVPCIDLDSCAFDISFVQSFTHTAPVVKEEAPVMHKLDAATLEDRATLRTVVHDCHLFGRVCISDSDGLSNGVIIGRLLLVSHQSPVRSLI